MVNRKNPHTESAPVDDSTPEVQIAEIAAKYRAPLRAYFLRRGHSVADAEDLVQEAFVRLLRLPKTETINNTEAYLFRVAANLLRDRGRRLGTYRRYFDPNAEADKASEVFGPERVLLGRESLHGVLQGLAALSEKTRDIFMLQRLEGMKYAEIAALYGISQSAVEKHMIKALACVAAYLAKDNDDQ